MRILRFALLLPAMLTASAWGWIDTGHMAVVAIAECEVKPEVKAVLERLVKVGGDERTQDLLGAACWADDTRTRENGPWHYINHHFRRDGSATPNLPEPQNVVWAIEKFAAVLRDRSKPDAERADALRYVLHFVGDIHQPLHTTACDSDEFPKGDRGGNDFTFPEMKVGEFNVRNLHFLWDIAGGLYGSTQRPLADRSSIDRLATQLMTLHPRGSFPEIKNTSPMAWSREGEMLSRSVVYSVNPKVIGEEYLGMVRYVAGRQIALAGYRLADLLNQLLG